MRDRCEITSTDTQKRNWSKNSDTKRNWSENSDTKRNWSKNSDTKRNWSKKSDTKRYTDIYTEKEYEKSRKIKRKIQVVTAVYSTLSDDWCQVTAVLKERESGPISKYFVLTV